MKDYYTEKNRIWQLDALKGIAIIVMVAIHILRIGKIHGIGPGLPAWLLPFSRYGGSLFVLISGICSSNAKRNISSGIKLLGWAAVFWIVTRWLYTTGRDDARVLIRFGVLALLGVCKLLAPLLKKLPAWLLTVLSVPIIITGYVIRNMTFHVTWLYFLGFKPAGFKDFDIHPLLPHLGWFMLGMAIGAYIFGKAEEKRAGSSVPSDSGQNCKTGSSVPSASGQAYGNSDHGLSGSGQTNGARIPAAAAFLCFVGSKTYIIYLVHFPLVYAAVRLLAGEGIL